MKTLEQILTTKEATSLEMLTIYDSLAPVTTNFMVGRWKGFEIATGHQLDGMLEPSGWYGKMFIDTELVHPLVMYGSDRRTLWALSPKLIPLDMKLPKTSALSWVMKLLKPFLQTRASKARLRMVEHRGRYTATMLYDDKAIYDHFVKINDNTVLGCMDLKGVDSPYFWVMERDDKTAFELRFKH